MPAYYGMNQFEFHSGKVLKQAKSIIEVLS
jgi:hypothetical protein